MMKYIFVLALLQVCYSVPLNATGFTSNPNLNREIYNELQNLNKNINHTKPMPIPIPGDYMLNNASKCVATFSQKLRHFLGNMTQKDKVKAIINRLISKLVLLAKNVENSNSNCTMTMKKLKMYPFKKHIDFITKLNSRR